MASGASVLKGEIHNVLSVMRLNTRWASEERFRREIPLQAETPLLYRLKELQELLNDHAEMRDLEASVFLRPFVDIAVSPQAGNLVTGMALGAMQKFLLYGIVSMDSLSAFDGANMIADAVCRCRFEETDRDLDEVVLMNLLDLTQSCLRSDVGVLLTDDSVWGLFEACFRISRQVRTSPLLRTTAFNTLANMVLIVFGRTEDFLAMSPPPVKPAASRRHSRSTSFHAEKADGVLPARQRIIKYLANLADDRVHDLRTCMLALSLMNVALETGGANLTQETAVVEVLRTDLCRVLLQNSQADDLNVLTLVLRVIFNLFNSIKEHMKVQLEVFLLSVHVALVESSSASNAQKELALESLLEFCREPLLMLDLYINYDCDVNCTNLFETICKALARTASPPTRAADAGPALEAFDLASRAAAKCYALANPRETLELAPAPPVTPNLPRLAAARANTLNVLNKLALEGILAVIEAIAKRCRATPRHPVLSSLSQSRTDDDHSDAASVPFTPGVQPGLASFQDSLGDDVDPSVDDGDAGAMDDTQQWLATARDRTARILQERKKLKKRMELVKRCFNGRPRLATEESGISGSSLSPGRASNLGGGKKDWIELAGELGVFPPTGGGEGRPSPESVARFLKETAGLDKRKIGEYIGKGPADKYPFIDEVRTCYARMMDFREMPFHAALRGFLEGFHLPGEAQCIDRLMECFAIELFDQWSSLPSAEEAPALNEDAGSQTSASFSDEPMLVNPFRSSDAAFILSFSAIMLNTDLHNPNLPEEKRMTLVQFKRNNRGINDGADLPERFLEDLYESIRNQEVRVRHDIVGLTDSGVRDTELFIGAMEQRFSGAQSLKHMASSAIFARTNSPMPETAAAQAGGVAGLHEREMFAVTCGRTREAIGALLERSIDDLLVVKCLDGLCRYARICRHFGLATDHRRVLLQLLGYAEKYTAQLMYDPFLCAVRPPHALGTALAPCVSDGDEARLPVDRARLLPVPSPNLADWSGAASHRGLCASLLALHLLVDPFPARDAASDDGPDSRRDDKALELAAAIVRWCLQLWWHGLLPRKMQILSEPGVELPAQTGSAGSPAAAGTFHPNPSFDPLVIQQRDPAEDRRRRRRTAIAALRAPDGAAASGGFGFLGLGLGNVFTSVFPDAVDATSPSGERAASVLADGPSVLKLGLDAMGVAQLLGYGVGDRGDPLLVRALLALALERCQATLTQYPDGEVAGNETGEGGSKAASAQQRIRPPAEAALLLEWAGVASGLGTDDEPLARSLAREWQTFFAAFFDGNSRSKYAYVTDGGLFCIERAVVALLLLLRRGGGVGAARPAELLGKLGSLPHAVVRRLGPRLALGHLAALSPVLEALADAEELAKHLAYLTKLLAQVPQAEGGCVAFLETLVPRGLCSANVLVQARPLLRHLCVSARQPVTRARALASLSPMAAQLLAREGVGLAAVPLWEEMIDLCLEALLDAEEKISRAAFEALGRLFLDVPSAAPPPPSDPEHTTPPEPRQRPMSMAQWADTFGRVLARLPMAPFGEKSDGGGAVRVSVEAQLRSISLASRVFTSSVTDLAAAQLLGPTWIAVANFYGTILATTVPTSMTHESAAQLLANMIIFLTHEGHLEGARGRETWDLLDRLAPDMRSEVQMVQGDIELPPQNTALELPPNEPLHRREAAERLRQLEALANRPAPEPPRSAAPRPEASRPEAPEPKALEPLAPEPEASEPPNFGPEPPGPETRAFEALGPAKVDAGVSEAEQAAAAPPGAGSPGEGENRRPDLPNAEDAGPTMITSAFNSVVDQSRQVKRAVDGEKLDNSPGGPTPSARARAPKSQGARYSETGEDVGGIDGETEATPDVGTPMTDLSIQVGAPTRVEMPRAPEDDSGSVETEQPTDVASAAAGGPARNGRGPRRARYTPAAAELTPTRMQRHLSQGSPFIV